MHDRQHRGGSGGEGDTAKRVPPLLSGLVYPVAADEAVFVLKGQCRQLE
jgi:hypothetical protein